MAPDRTHVSDTSARVRYKAREDEPPRSRAAAAVIPAVLFGLGLAIAAFALPFGGSAVAGNADGADASPQASGN